MVLELVHFNMIRLLMLKNTNPKIQSAVSGVCCVSEVREVFKLSERNTYISSSADCSVSEQHSPAIPYEPGGHT